MLKLINAERAQANLPPVVLGRNIAAQLHAESLLENQVLSHWGTDGLKPYMRYTLAGGVQYNQENVSYQKIFDASSGEAADSRGSLDVTAAISSAMTGYMNSPGHRRNILGRWHRQVSIGLAWNGSGFRSVQHFEGDYVEFHRLPSIENGTLSMSGRTKNGVRFVSADDLSINIYYDPPPHPLTRGQLWRTTSYGFAQVAAALGKPLPWGESYQGATYTFPGFPDPYQISPASPAPRTIQEERQISEETARASKETPPQTVKAPIITASQWPGRSESFPEALGKLLRQAVGMPSQTDDGNGNETFTVTADLSDVLRSRGAGVYTLHLFTNVDGEDMPVAEYSIFHGVTPPDTYNVR